MLAALPWVIAGGSALAQTFGGNRRDATPASSQSGYAAMAPWMQELFREYGSKLGPLLQDPVFRQRMAMAQKPEDIFGSQELYDYQQTQPDRGVRPVGVKEPLNQWQRETLNRQGAPEARLADYMMGMQGIRNRTQEGINRGANMDLNRIVDSASRAGSLTPGSRYKQLVPLVEEGRARSLADSESLFNAKAQQYKDQVYNEKGQAGNYIQQQNQLGLDIAQPGALTQQNPVYAQLQAILPLLQGLPGSSISTGAQSAQPGLLQRLGGIGSYLSSHGTFNGLGSSLSQMFNGGQQASPWVNPDATRGQFITG